MDYVLKTIRAGLKVSYRLDWRSVIGWIEVQL
jgi:hypothetical protein